MIPKIAFLFLTVGNIYHEDVWRTFFKDHADSYSLYVHAKTSLAPHSFFASAAIAEKVPTTWEHTMEAQRALLREALKDPANTKFVFLSESTIPLMPFEGVYRHLLSHEQSEFTFQKNIHKKRTFGGIEQLYFNPQWIVLNRKHAQLMVDDRQLIELFRKFACDNEHYPSTLLAKHMMLDEVVNRDTTFVLWKEKGPHPHLFKNLKRDPFTKDLIAAIRNKLLFARKFASTCDLSFLHRYVPELFPEPPVDDVQEGNSLNIFFKEKYPISNG